MDGHVLSKTDTRRCVPFNCCHPKQCKNNITFTLARRICIVLEDSQVWKKTIGQTLKRFTFLRISTNLIQEAIRKSTNIPIKNLRVSKGNNDSNNLTFVTTFNPNNKSAFPVIETAFESVKQSCI